MKVCVLSPPMEEVGGIQTYTATLVRALRRICGEEAVLLVSLSGPGAVPVAKGPRMSLASKARFFWRAFREASARRPRLIICTHIGLAPLGYILSEILGSTFWVSAHGIEVWGRLSPGKKLSLRAAGKVLAVSAFTRSRILDRHRISASHAIVLPNALDEELLSVAPDDRKLVPLRLAAKRPVLTVGRLAAAERYKGHDVMLRSLPAILAKFPSTVYLLAGDGDDRNRLETLAREIGVRHAVVFLGSLNRAELSACYRACEILAMPARTVLDDSAPKGEGFGLAYIEAMAFARPVIGPVFGAPAEFIRDGENGLLVDPENPRRVADATISLLARPDWARELGERGRLLVEKEYSFPALIQRLTALMATLE